MIHGITYPFVDPISSVTPDVSDGAANTFSGAYAPPTGTVAVAITVRVDTFHFTLDGTEATIDDCHALAPGYYTFSWDKARLENMKSTMSAGNIYVTFFKQGAQPS